MNQASHRLRFEDDSIIVESIFTQISVEIRSICEAYGRTHVWSMGENFV